MVNTQDTKSYTLYIMFTIPEEIEKQGLERITD